MEGIVHAISSWFSKGVCEILRKVIMLNGLGLFLFGPCSLVFCFFISLFLIIVFYATSRVLIYALKLLAGFCMCLNSPQKYIQLLSVNCITS